MSRPVLGTASVPQRGWALAALPQRVSTVFLAVLLALLTCSGVSDAVRLATTAEDSPDRYIDRVVVTTAAELRAAVSHGTAHIIVKEHLDMRNATLGSDHASPGEAGVLSVALTSSIRVRCDFTLSLFGN